MDLDIEGNAALVTASSAGLGYASAEALAADGADVAICGRTPERLQRAEERLAAAGDGDVLAVEADVTDPDEVAALVETTAAEFGGLDHLVTSAGDPASGPFLETDDRDWIEAYEILVMSVVWATRAAYPHLADGDGGSIVTIGSLSAREVLDGAALSNAVRRPVVGLVKTLAREFAPAVRVNAVLPGPHETESLSGLIDEGVERGQYDSYEDGLDAWASDVPLDRIADPRETGDVVAFLSSPRASFVNGAAVPIDGGATRS